MDFYYAAYSAPCRSVMLTAKALGVELNLKPINLQEKEQFTPEFLKINPQHTIPTLVDGGFAIWESRAIIIYLVENYGKNDDSLYPKQPKTRAVINQRLYFDMGTYYQSLADYYYPQFFRKQPADPENLKKVEDALRFFETFLDGQTHAVGDTYTIADIALLASTTAFDVFGVDISKYPGVYRWYQRMQKETTGWQEFYDVFVDELKKHRGK